MENSLFWDAQEVEGILDRVYSSDDFAAMFAGFWGNGIIPNASTALLVEPIENSFAVVVNAGDAMLKGRFYQNTDDVQFTLANGNAETRVDYIALRYDYAHRKVYLKLLQGADGEGAPSYAQSDTLFDMLLARITIPANAQYLTDEMVEDLRGTSYAPWINLRFDLDAIVDSFQAWYDGVRETLDEDVAVTLQNQITALETKHNQDIAALEAQHEQDITNLETEITNTFNECKRADTVIKENAIYIRTRPYDASIDTDIP